jgi:hypothetical protein
MSVHTSARLSPTLHKAACRYSNRLSAALLCLSILQLTIFSALSGGTLIDDPLCSLWRYSNRLSHVHCSVWRCYNQLSSVLCLPIFQPTIRRSTLPVDITTDYLLYRLSSLLSLAVLQSTIYSAVLGLSILKPNFVSTLFHCVCRHYNRPLSALLRDSDGILSERDRATICSALSCDSITNYLLCFSAPSLIVNSLKLHHVFILD